MKNKNIVTLEKKFDLNGNRIVIVRDKIENRSFSIQTGGNLPFTHELNLMAMTNEDLDKALIEIKVFVTKYESLRKQSIIENVLLNRNIFTV